MGSSSTLRISLRVPTCSVHMVALFSSYTRIGISCLRSGTSSYLVERMCGWMCGAPTVTTQIFTGARRWCYYGFIVLDIFFRVSWAWRFSDLGSSWIPFALSVVEIFRRAMWFPLRIEGWQVSLGIGPRGTAEAVVEVPPTGAAAMGEVELPPAL
ncbi:hypothetical protein C5167_048259 [Papaver somniferum]|uniref:EXS domain-containing protein n=1 Tax=Papaver somniferum TaxID=3469 RepID=A0A4Y7KIU2_PAPSO|nr:hypothetical protein C5167_048259 [Papaver somniferum]